MLKRWFEVTDVEISSFPRDLFRGVFIHSFSSVYRCTRKRTRTFATVQVGYQSTDGPVTVLQMEVMMPTRTYKPHQTCTSLPVTNSYSSMSICSPINFIMEGMGAECDKKNFLRTSWKLKEDLSARTISRLLIWLLFRVNILGIFFIFGLL